MTDGVTKPTTIAASPLDTPTVAAGTVRDDAGFAPRLASESPLAAALRSAPAGPTAELHFEGPSVAIETAGPPTADAVATTPGTTGTEALESATLDEILGRESPFASPRAHAESRSLAPTPATRPSNTQRTKLLTSSASYPWRIMWCHMQRPVANSISLSCRW